ncbi:DUF2877 domain-containing protein [Enterobacter sp. CC120223-11]|uniref:DUF2877 domain-containing protein n=1 Tax=Enterobacter sp. CC120223-11 TaxID=1378073 RepID=UPI000BD1BC55|nr:DUF2877 domain-containing protein [Enterobacter sp. CC120223-11]SNY77410.1 Protein of unknown function [Enterobacter sp. CC120223-11]
MSPLSLRSLSVGYLAVKRLAASENGRLRIHSTFRNTLNLQLDDGALLPLISARGSLNHPDAVRVAVAESWDWRGGAEIHFAHGTLLSPDWQLPLAGTPIWSPETLQETEQESLKTCLPFLENQLRAWCQQQNVDSVLRLLPDDRFGIPVTIGLTDDEETLEKMVARTLGFGRGLTPDGDDYLLGYLAALWLATQSLVSEHRRRFIAALAPGLNSTNDISRHYLNRAVLGHFSEAICRLRTGLTFPFDPKTIGERATAVMAFGASSGADCMAGFLHGLRNITA